MGFYEKYGLDVDVIKTAGWAVARDKSLNKEYDAFSYANSNAVSDDIRFWIHGPHLILCQQ